MRAANHESPPGALAGMRVLDVAAPLGAFVSRILGDLGADVIKIEPPGRIRAGTWPPFSPRAGSASASPSSMPT